MPHHQRVAAHVGDTHHNTDQRERHSKSRHRGEMRDQRHGANQSEECSGQRAMTEATVVNAATQQRAAEITNRLGNEQRADLALAHVRPFA